MTSARPSGITAAVDEISLAAPASVIGEALLDTEDMSPAHLETAGVAATNFPTVALQTGSDAAVVEDERTHDRSGRALQGRLEKSDGMTFEGWAWDSQAPDSRIRLELLDGDTRLSVFVADTYRPDLVQLGCGDGRHGFRIEMEEGQLDEGTHVLTLRCADTRAPLPGSPIVAQRKVLGPISDLTTAPIANSGQVHLPDIVEEDPDTKLNKEPVRWLSGLDAALTTKARPSDGSDNKLSSAVCKSDSASRLRHVISRSDHTRCRQMGRFSTRGVTESVLAVTDLIRETGTLPSRFLTDSMIAAWMSRKDLQQRFPQLDEETCQYGLLVWFLCVRPIVEGLVLSWEPTSPVLTAMSKVIVAEEAGVGCSALMLAAYYYVAGYQGSEMLAPAQCQASEIVEWFFCEGAYHLRLSHAIQQDARAKLAAYRSNGVSTILEWAERRVPAFDATDLTGSRRILAGLARTFPQPMATCWTDLLRESLIVEDRAQFDDPLVPILPAVCGRLRDSVRDMSDLLLSDGEPEYMCIGGNGERLLLKNEWYPLEPKFVWSRAPISTVLFCIAGGAVEWLRVGLMFDQSPLPEREIRVMLNHNSLWLGTISDASSGELILACSGRCLAQDAPNLLQIEVDRAFVPSEETPSLDNRRLGIGLKRLWIQRGKGLSE